MNSRMRLKVSFVAGIAALSMAFASTGRAQSQVTLNYALWDTNQLPAYQQCAAAFTAKNPNITVKITQQGWSDYWTTLQTGFTAGTAPDVFTDHLAYYPQFVQLAQLVDLQPMIDRDKVATDVYYPGLADLWVKDGKRYGLPKDWDTISVVYNADMLKAAGIDPKIMDTWTWNPTDGGDFYQVIAKLTLDKNGNNALSANFDPSNIVQYGFANSGLDGSNGQTEYSAFSSSNGFTYNNGIWGNHYNYDDPKFAQRSSGWPILT